MSSLHLSVWFTRATRLSLCITNRSLFPLPATSLLIIYVLLHLYIQYFSVWSPGLGKKGFTTHYHSSLIHLTHIFYSLVLFTPCCLLSCSPVPSAIQYLGCFIHLQLSPTIFTSTSLSSSTLDSIGFRSCFFPPYYHPIHPSSVPTSPPVLLSLVVFHINLPCFVPPPPIHPVVVFKTVVTAGDRQGQGTWTHCHRPQPITV